MSRFQNSIWTPLPLASTFIQVLLRSKPWHWCWVSGITGPRVKEWSKDFMTNIAGDEWRKVFWNATLHTQNVLQVTFIGLSGAKKLTAENFWSSHRNLGVQISANGDYVALLYMTYATVSNYIHVTDAYSCRVFFSS